MLNIKETAAVVEALGVVGTFSPYVKNELYPAAIGRGNMSVEDLTKHLAWWHTEQEIDLSEPLLGVALKIVSAAVGNWEASGYSPEYWLERRVFEYNTKLPEAWQKFFGNLYVTVTRTGHVPIVELHALWEAAKDDTPIAWPEQDSYYIAYLMNLALLLEESKKK